MVRKLHIPILALVIFIVIFASVVRFYNFENRINFGPEQAISLLVTADYINEKFTLLGEPNVQRITSFGHRIFHPPVFNYSLIPFLLIFNYDPLPITAYFCLLNLFTGVILYWVINKYFNVMVAIFSVVLFLFNSVMIQHSLFIWNQNYIPLLSILIGLVAYKIKIAKGKSEFKFAFILGILSGLILGIEFIFLITMIFIFGLAYYWSKHKFFIFSGFTIGIIISLSPMIIFDLRHQFYFLNTLMQYFFDTLKQPGQNNLSYYHFLQFWPLLALSGGLILAKIYSKVPLLAICLTFTYIFLNLISSQINFTKAMGMNTNLNYRKLTQAVESIARDKPISFNVTTTWDFDSQAHPLRYLMKYRQKLTPASTENYSEINNIYIMSNPDYNFQDTTLYEIASFRPFNVALLTKIDNDYSVFKLSQAK